MNIEYKIIFIGISLLVLFILMSLTKRVTKKITLVKKLEPNRKKIVLNTFYFLYYLFFFAVLTVILGIDLEKLSYFISSMIAVLGIAFVAQWSLLSNLTASIIIFFYHPLKIGDKVRILDKEFDFKGEVTNITGFYITIHTDERQDIIIPNSLVLQKGIEFFNE